MSRQPVIAFLPCRSGSQRVPNKNTRPFAGRAGGLIEIKIQQLLEATLFDHILVSTDDAKVREICSKYGNKAAHSLRVVDRPKELVETDISTDTLIAHIPEIVANGIILWTHVTLPFVGPDIYDEAIRAYRKYVDRGEYDSLMSVSRFQNFMWDENGPINYDRQVEKWPQTQSLPVYYEINNAIFMAPLAIYQEKHDRVGERPYFFELSPSHSLDIDVMEDFEFAELLMK